MLYTIETFKNSTSQVSNVFKKSYLLIFIWGKLKREGDISQINRLDQFFFGQNSRRSIPSPIPILQIVKS